MARMQDKTRRFTSRRPWLHEKYYPGKAEKHAWLESPDFGDTPNRSLASWAPAPGGFLPGWSHTSGGRHGLPGCCIHWFGPDSLGRPLFLLTFSIRARRGRGRSS